MIQKLIRHHSLFEKLIRRNFKKGYKRTALGMLWSIISPPLALAIIAAVLTQFFERSAPYYIIRVFYENLTYSCFSDATADGICSLMANAVIFTRADVPKYMFLLPRDVQAFINFLLTLVVLLLSAAFDPGLPFRWSFLLLIYPIVCLTLFNIGVGMVLSAFYVLFRDIEYLYSVSIMLLMYLSTIFYNIEVYTLKVQYLFYASPAYVYIRCFRKVVIGNDIPEVSFHPLCALYALLMLGIGCWMYKKYNHKFLYYVQGDTV